MLKLRQVKPEKKMNQRNYGLIKKMERNKKLETYKMMENINF
jgi:hypothetical protein